MHLLQILAPALLINFSDRLANLPQKEQREFFVSALRGFSWRLSVDSFFIQERQIATPGP
jgi:hypothetical protein